MAMTNLFADSFNLTLMRNETCHCETSSQTGRGNPFPIRQPFSSRSSSSVSP